ncbi:hypothetical protein KHX94_11810 [Shewanella dokdonensis]|uniref:Lipoprotein n=1 Tax=Shewanella dokdonensis TaxID=712036 RepID=A0ABX8DEC8_9GAMM|nr:hypothetical protein [Shewanella dokdonensis]QVK22132.1 hypothetical protein KHX94_11810 [Shewanella dokdonensis]
MTSSTGSAALVASCCKAVTASVACANAHKDPSRCGVRLRRFGTLSANTRPAPSVCLPLA